MIPARSGYPNEAVKLVYQRTLQLRKDYQLESAPHLRYVWIPQPTKELVGTTEYAINTAVSTNINLVASNVLFNGRLLEINLEKLAPKKEDYDRLLKIWEELARKEPFFHQLKVVKQEKRVPVASYRAQDGRWYNYKIETKEETVAAFSNHLDPEIIVIANFLESDNPIVRYDWFVTKILSNRHGGVYYDLQGLDKDLGKAQGKTDEQVWLERFGANEQDSIERDAQSRAGILHSKVTSRPRRVDAFYGTAMRPTAGSPLITITKDISEDDIKVENHPIKNLINFKFSATEAIAQKQNGMLAFALFDAKGALQKVVPDNIAHDDTIPSPFPTILEAGASCLRCHLPHDGRIPIANNVQEMYNFVHNFSGYKADVFDPDETSKNDLLEDLEKANALYSGDLEVPLRIARDFHAQQTFKVTGGMTPPQVGVTLTEIYRDYMYSLVTAQEMCSELGFPTKTKEEAVDLLKELLRPLPNNAFGFAPEDATVIAILTGNDIVRNDWEQAYAAIAIRVKTRLLQLETRKKLEQVERKEN